MTCKPENDMITTREAADILGWHIDTVVRHAKEALDGRGTLIKVAEVDYSRARPRYLVSAEDVRALASRRARSFDSIDSGASLGETKIEDLF